MPIHNAEDCEQAVYQLKQLLTHIRERGFTDEEWERFEPRIRLSYGDYTVDILNIAQTYDAFLESLRTMISEIENNGW